MFQVFSSKKRVRCLNCGNICKVKDTTDEIQLVPTQIKLSSNKDEEGERMRAKEAFINTIHNKINEEPDEDTNSVEALPAEDEEPDEEEDPSPIYL